MDAARWKQIDELLDAALETDPGNRVDFVTERAGVDTDLRNQVLELLKAQEPAGDFLNDSAMHVAAKAMADAETEVSSFAFINKRIAHFKIERLLGAGGMGEVYLAFDEKLDRKVALKILPSEYITNDERVKRFEQEARAIAKLNHPGIVTVYDVGNFEGVNYIATEFVEGKTLRDLMNGKFKIRNIVLNSIQICDALAAAHAEGIIHRDIKPENIMIRKDGYAKILDFGLAKLTDPGANTIRDVFATTKGVIIGTPAYMSPAQVTDDKVDHRTDLWSCGVVLYEFLAGKNPFKGTNKQETFHNILSADVEPCSSHNPEVPRELDKILAKLMSKRADDGYQSASELRGELKGIQRELDSVHSWSDSVRMFQTSRGPDLATILASSVATLLLAAVLVGIYYFSTRAEPSTAIDWASANNINITDQPGVEYFPSLSSDGRYIVYAGQENGQFDIFRQEVGTRERVNLTPGIEADDTQPSFSPNGAFVAFRSERPSGRGIYIVPASGGEPRLLADAGYHPSWSNDGSEIVVSDFGRDEPTVRASSGRHALTVINVASGLRRELASVEASFPAWSPNGHRIAYWFYTGTFGRRDIATIPAGGGEPVLIAKDFAVSNWNPVWSPDGKYLYFVSSRSGNVNFWRVRIDEKSGTVIGQPESVITPSSYSRHLTFAKDGKRLAYVRTNNTANIQGIEFDAASAKTIGQPFWITQGDRELSRAELSPDGSQFIARLVGRTQDDIITISRDGKQIREVTNDEPFDRYVRWSPDGKRIAFSSDRNGGGQIWATNADGSGLKQLTFNSSADMATGFPVWSPDGTKLAVYFDGTTFLLNPNQSQTEQNAETLPKDERFRLVAWDWSPDGKKLLGVVAEGDKRHIGYYSFETNSYEIVLENSTSVGSWLPDSRRIVYGEGSCVYMLDIVTKERTRILENPEIQIRSPFVSRDGKLLYYTASNAESDIWLLDLKNDHVQ
jgi:serine/threonine protein kinase/tricorn protease-like protein